jgi:hypothetical protein
MGLLRRYTPRTVLEKAAVSVRAGLLDIPDEELHLAFLFMDIKGFTRYSETRPPDEVIAAINGFLGPATECVYRHGGDVDNISATPRHHVMRRRLAAALEMQRHCGPPRNGSSSTPVGSTRRVSGTAASSAATTRSSATR